MKIVLKQMEILCEHSTTAEKIPFSPQVTYFYGEMSTGKSTIARLIVFCLGGSFKNIPPTILEEIRSVQLLAVINSKEVLFEREIKNANQIKISWKDDEGKPVGVLAPTEPGDWPILGEQIYSASDFILHLFNQPVLKVPIGDKLVRLSIRDLMWYCNLKQEELVSNFYNLGENINHVKMLKSRIVMRFMLGLFDEKINEIEKAQFEILLDRKKTEQDIQSAGFFLSKFGYGSEEQLNKEIENVTGILKSNNSDLKKTEGKYHEDTHFAEPLRKEIKDLDDKIIELQTNQTDLRESIEEKLELKAELISSKAKLSRSTFAKEILEGAKFEYCPACGLQIKRENSGSEACILCGQIPKPTPSTLYTNQVMQLDLADRIKALEESIDRQRVEYNKQKTDLGKLEETKHSKEAKLNETLIEYDSPFLSQNRELERQTATYEERLNYLNKISNIPMEVSDLKQLLTKLEAKEKKLELERETEMSKRQSAESFINQIELGYHEALLAMKLPNINADDTIKINRTTWIPEIIPANKTKGKWSFFNVGSTGMEALLNVCYALVIHKVAARNNLPVPTILIIDSPARYVDKDIDKTVFDSYYAFLYKLSSGELSNTQFILIDNYFAATPDGIQLIKRYMTRDDPNNPPLIPYMLTHKRSESG